MSYSQKMQRSFSSWIRFRELNLRNLLEGVEAVSKDEQRKNCNKIWVENGRNL